MVVVPRFRGASERTSIYHGGMFHTTNDALSIYADCHRISRTHIHNSDSRTNPASWPPVIMSAVANQTRTPCASASFHPHLREISIPPLETSLPQPSKARDALAVLETFYLRTSKTYVSSFLSFPKPSQSPG